MPKAAQAAVEQGVTPEVTSEEVVVETKVETKATEPKVITLTPDEYLNERVPFKAIWDGEKYKDDIVVTLNGKNWVIQRGVEVMLPRYVLFAIYDSEDQKIVALRTSMVFENQYKQNLAANMM